MKLITFYKENVNSNLLHYDYKNEYINWFCQINNHILFPLKYSLRSHRYYKYHLLF